MSVGTLTQPVKHPKAEGYNLLINNTWYRTIANSAVPLTIGTRDSLAERVDQRGSIYENVLDIGYAWARTDLSGGEGLDWDPREIALDERQTALDIVRYWDSVGIDVRRPDTAGQQYSLRLGRGDVLWGGTVTDPKDLGVSEQFIYVADGVTVTWYDSWNNLTPIGTDTLPDTIIAIAVSPNDTVLVTLEDGTMEAKNPDEAVFTPVYTDGGAAKLAAKGVWYVNGRFVVSAYDDVENASLFEMTWDGAAWVDGTPFDTASSPYWSVVESGPAIVAACGDGTVRTYTPDNASGGTMALEPRARTTMPEGETPILLGSNAGVLLIFTTATREAADRDEVRIYQAEVLDARFDFVVGQLQLRREWLASDHEPLVTRNITNTRDEMYWFVKEETNGVLLESLWRYDVVTTGLSRVIYFPEDVNLNGLVIFDSIIGGIDFTNDTIVLGDDTLHQVAGYVIFPNITFGLNTDIAWLTTIVEAHDLVEAGAQVELWRSTDPEAILDEQHPSWILVQKLTTRGASGIEVPLTGILSRTLSLMLRIKSTNSGDISPKVTRIGLRGIPAHRDLVMMVPVNISDYVSVPGRSPLRVPGLGHDLHKQIISFVGKNVQVELIDPPLFFRGVVNNISEPIEYLAERGSVTRYVMVEFRGQELLASEIGTGTDGLGLGMIGFSLLGVGSTDQI